MTHPLTPAGANLSASATNPWVSVQPYPSHNWAVFDNFVYKQNINYEAVAKIRWSRWLLDNDHLTNQLNFEQNLLNFLVNFLIFEYLSNS